jgi:hypothetical protein
MKLRMESTHDHSKLSFKLHKKWITSWTAGLQSSSEGLCSMELYQLYFIWNNPGLHVNTDENEGEIHLKPRSEWAEGIFKMIIT